MYTTPDEARSDLMLTAAVFVFGPIVLTLMFTVLPITRIELVANVVRIVQPIVLTVLVPFLLVRYRGESWSAYRFGGQAAAGLGAGAAFALPLVVASVVAATVLGAPPTDGLPVLQVTNLASALFLVERIVTWTGLAVLAVYVAGKARDAFRSDFRGLQDGMLEIGRILAVVIAVAALLHLAFTADLRAVLLPLGLVAATVLVYRGASGPGSVTRATLLAPTVLLALGSLFISFSLLRLVTGVWTAGLVAGAGLAMSSLSESRRSAWYAVGFGLAIGLLTLTPVPLRLM